MYPQNNSNDGVKTAQNRVSNWQDRAKLSYFINLLLNSVLAINNSKYLSYLDKSGANDENS